MIRFLDTRAALVSQKALVGYCQVKTSLPVAELLREKPFAEAFSRAQWESYAAVLADLIAILAGRLRPYAADAASAALLADRLARLFATILARHPLPPHRTDGWAQDVAAFRSRLAELAEAPPRSIGEISRVSARKVFQAMPIHERLRAADAPAMEAGVQFQLVGLAREFDRDLDHAALYASLSGTATGTAAST